jgi:hypothetical protein
MYLGMFSFCIVLTECLAILLVDLIYHVVSHGSSLSVINRLACIDS